LTLLFIETTTIQPLYLWVITQHKHTKQHKYNQTRQTIEKGWFNILDLFKIL
jgi:hypothetical protein